MNYVVEEDPELLILLAAPRSAGIMGFQACTTNAQFILCWGQTQGLVHARQVLYQLSHFLTPRTQSLTDLAQVSTRHMGVMASTFTGPYWVGLSP